MGGAVMSANWWFEGRPREGARHAMHASVLPFLDGGSRCRQRWASCAGADSRRLAWSFLLKRNTCTARDGVPQTSLVALGLEIRGARGNEQSRVIPLLREHLIV